MLTSGLFASRWIGRLAPQLEQLPLEPGQPTLLYFRTRGCTICGLIDMQVAAACHRGGVRLVIVDRHAKSEEPEALEIYTQPGNILDVGGPINTAYQIGVYPSFVLVKDGLIVFKDVGIKARHEVYGEYLQKRFAALMA